VVSECASNTQNALVVLCIIWINVKGGILKKLSDFFKTWLDFLDPLDLAVFKSCAFQGKLTKIHRKFEQSFNQTLERQRFWTLHFLVILFFKFITASDKQCKTTSSQTNVLLRTLCLALTRCFVRAHFVWILSIHKPRYLES